MKDEAGCSVEILLLVFIAIVVGIESNKQGHAKGVEAGAQALASQELYAKPHPFNEGEWIISDTPTDFGQVCPYCGRFTSPAKATPRTDESTSNTKDGE